MKPPCAICGFRDAQTLTDWADDDGSTREVYSCFGCKEPNVDPRAVVLEDELSLAQRALRALKAEPGSTCGELCEALGIAGDAKACGAVYRGMSRAVADGRATRDGGRYYPTDRIADPVRPSAPVIVATCEGCGAPFETSTARSKRRRYCTRVCANEYRGRVSQASRSLPCEHCGVLFTPRSVSDGQRFCSLPCHTAHRYARRAA